MSSLTSSTSSSSSTSSADDSAKIESLVQTIGSADREVTKKIIQCALTKIGEGKRRTFEKITAEKINEALKNFKDNIGINPKNVEGAIAIAAQILVPILIEQSVDGSFWAFDGIKNWWSGGKKQGEEKQ